MQISLGKHIQVQNNEEVKRSYTPISSLTRKGSFDLLVKKGEGGKVSSYLHSLKIGDKVDIRGPTGGIKLKSDYQKHRNIGMIAAGTGITPLFQLIQSFSEQENARLISVTLLFANRTEKDILLEEEMGDLSHKLQNLKIIHVLSRVGDNRHIDEEILKNSLNQIMDHIYICGSVEFAKDMKSHLLSLQFPQENVSSF